MKIASTLLFIFSLFLITACSDEQGAIKLNIKMTYGDEPFEMFEEYTYPSGETFYLKKVSMYLSDINAGDAFVGSTEYIDLTQSHEPGNEDLGLDILFEEVVPGNYSNLNFGIGVNATNNNKTPENFNSLDPLARSGEYWSAWSSYVFYKIEGELDTDNDGEFETGIVLHVGGNEAYNILTLDKDITVVKEQTTDVAISLDIRKVFENEGQIYDINAFPALHNKSLHLEQMKTLIENTKKAITVK